MSRLALTLSTLLAASGLAASAPAAVFYDPSPVPTPCQQPDAPRLADRYVRQLDVLNRYVTVDLMQRTCAEEPLYWRKLDLLRAAHDAALAAPSVSSATPAATPRGTILIIPKRLMDQRLRDVKSPAVARAE